MGGYEEGKTLPGTKWIAGVSPAPIGRPTRSRVPPGQTPGGRGRDGRTPSHHPRMGLHSATTLPPSTT